MRLPPQESKPTLLDALLDSWDRSNVILLNLLHAVPAVGLGARATDGSPTVAQLFTHIHYVRLVFVFDDAPERAVELIRAAQEASADLSPLSWTDADLTSDQ